ncbi:hypothetical protein Tco_0417808 [Tanacetum coccineum]
MLLRNGCLGNLVKGKCSLIPSISLELDEFWRCPNPRNAGCIISYREPFPNLTIVRSVITTEEMRLKAKSQALAIDPFSSTPMVLLAESTNNARRGNRGGKTSAPDGHRAKRARAKMGTGQNGQLKFGSNGRGSKR